MVEKAIQKAIQVMPRGKKKASLISVSKRFTRSMAKRLEDLPAVPKDMILDRVITKSSYGALVNLRKVIVYIIVINLQTQCIWFSLIHPTIF